MNGYVRWNHGVNEMDENTVMEENEKIIEDYIADSDRHGMERKALLMNTLLRYGDDSTSIVDDAETFARRVINGLERSRAKRDIPERLYHRTINALLMVYDDLDDVTIPRTLEIWKEKNQYRNDDCDDPWACVPCRSILYVLANNEELTPTEVAEELGVDSNSLDEHIHGMRRRDWLIEDRGELVIEPANILADQHRNLTYYARESDVIDVGDVCVLFLRHLGGGIGGLDYEGDTPVPRLSDDDVMQTATIAEAIDKLWVSLLTANQFLQQDKTRNEPIFDLHDQTMSDTIEWVTTT